MSGIWARAGGVLADADFDYEARIMLVPRPLASAMSGSCWGPSTGSPGDQQSWFDARTEMVADLAARGDEALRRGLLLFERWQRGRHLRDGTASGTRRQGR
jgi:hypothetical protein